MRDRSMKRNAGRSLLGLDDSISADNDAYNNEMSSSEQMMLQHNDDSMQRLGEKTDAMKGFVNEIHVRIQESNRLLDNMDSDMNNVSQLLGKTVSQIKQLARSGGGWHMFYLVLFMLFVFVILYFMMGSKKS